MQSYVAETCMGSSALRNQGAGKLLETSRKYFKRINLSTIPITRPEFERWLDQRTKKLLSQFPKKAQHFGTARKALNLFLRCACYNVLLDRTYHLRRIQRFLEVPVDSFTASHLMHYEPLLVPTKWNKIKRVTEEENRQFQEGARRLAKKWKVNRVDLDIFFYREELPKKYPTK
jgi:hypothetical protein